MHLTTLSYNADLFF